MSNLTSFLMGSLIGASIVGQVQPVKLEPGGSYGWDYNCLNWQGGPETLQSFEIWITSPSVQGVPGSQGGIALDPADKVTGIVIPESCVAAGTWQTLTDPIMQPLTPGAYKAWVRGIDTHGNKGDWSDPLVVSWDRVSPAVPTALRWTPAP
jgi:hypothetical protein